MSFPVFQLSYFVGLLLGARASSTRRTEVAVAGVVIRNESPVGN